MTQKGARRENYVRLPDDATLLELWKANGRNATYTAAVLGCTPAAVSYRLRSIGVEIGRAGEILDRITALETQIARLLELEGRVHALEGRPMAIALREDHRRIADGGRGARRQRRIR